MTYITVYLNPIISLNRFIIKNIPRYKPYTKPKIISITINFAPVLQN